MASLFSNIFSIKKRTTPAVPTNLLSPTSAFAPKISPETLARVGPAFAGSSIATPEAAEKAKGITSASIIKPGGFLTPEQSGVLGIKPPPVQGPIQSFPTGETKQLAPTGPLSGAKTQLPPALPSPITGVRPEDQVGTAEFRAKQGLPPLPPPETPSFTPETPTGARERPEAPEVPPSPEISPETADAVKSAEDAIRTSLELSPEALSTREDLDKLIESTKSAFLNIRGQPIALPFITGQLSAVEQRALSLAEPLEAKLARLQAKRTGSLEASKFALKRADRQAEIEREAGAPGDPFTLGVGQQRFDSEGNLIATGAEKGDTGFTLGTGQQRFDAEGNVIAKGVEKVEDRDTQVVNIGGRQVLVDTQTGAHISDLGPAPVSATAEGKAIERSEKAVEAQSSASRMVSSITEVLASGDLSKISGAIRTAITNREITNRMLNLKAALTLENIDKLKGAMSDKDLLFIEQAGSVISGSINEKGTSNLPTAVLEQELKNIRGMFQLQTGRTVTVTVIDPGSGEAELFENSTKAEIDNWFAQGLLVDFQ